MRQTMHNTSKRFTYWKLFEVSCTSDHRMHNVQYRRVSRIWFEYRGKRFHWHCFCKDSPLPSEIIRLIRLPRSTRIPAAEWKDEKSSLFPFLLVPFLLVPADCALWLCYVDITTNIDVIVESTNLRAEEIAAFLSIEHLSTRFLRPIR